MSVILPVRRAASAARRAPSPASSVAVARLLEGANVEDVVLDGRHLPALRREVAAEHDARGLGGRRGVERARRGRTPVGQQRGVLGVGEADATDVEARPVDEVELPEAQPILDGVELRDAVLVEGRERVPLRAVLGRARRPRSPPLARGAPRPPFGRRRGGANMTSRTACSASIPCGSFMGRCPSRARRRKWWPSIMPRASAVGRPRPCSAPRHRATIDEMNDELLTWHHEGLCGVGEGPARRTPASCSTPFAASSTPATPAPSSRRTCSRTRSPFASRRSMSTGSSTIGRVGRRWSSA